MSEPASIYELLAKKKKKSDEEKREKSVKSLNANVNHDEEAKKQFSPKAKKELKDFHAEANKQFDTSKKKEKVHDKEPTTPKGKKEKVELENENTEVKQKVESPRNNNQDPPSSPRDKLMGAFASKKKLDPVSSEKGTTLDSTGDLKNEKKPIDEDGIELEIDEELDDELFDANNFQSANPRLAEKVYKMASKPNETCVGKLLLVYRRKDTDDETEASHMITIRQPDGLRSFYINEATKSKLYRDKNGEVELHTCGQWAFDVERVGVKTVKAEK
jgi:hypothetical protein